ncbi:ribonuclease H-like domain-containing protein [Tanacetum coccineum]
MTSPYPTPPFTVPSPSESSFSIPTTFEPVFLVVTTEPVFESQTSHSAQPSQNNQPQFQQYNSTTVSSSNAKFPYLKKDEYETWAMKMEYWIMNSDHNLWYAFCRTIGRFEKKAGRKFKFNNKDAAKFDKKKVRCYQCSKLGHFAREYTGKKVDSKTRYSQFKIKELDKPEEPKALVSVNSMLNWSYQTESEIWRKVCCCLRLKVLMVLLCYADVGADDVSVTSSDTTDAETQFAFMGLSHQLRLNNASVWKNVANVPSFVPRPAYVPAGSRNRPTYVPAGRPFPAGWHNPAARPMTRPKSHYFQQFSRPGSYNQMDMDGGRWGTADNPHTNKDLGIVDSGCSRSMTGNKEKLADFVKIKGGTVTFGGGDGKITGKGTIRTSNFNFENVYYVEELQNFNLFSVSQICDTKNKVLFTDKECLVLSKEFQLPDSSQVVLRVPRRHNLYYFNLTDIHSEREIKCLLAKASLDESTKWHRRMAHVNFKNMNKLAKHRLVNGLPSKLFTNEHNCVACNKGVTFCI